MCLDVINQTWTALYGEFGRGIFFGDTATYCLKRMFGFSSVANMLLGMGKNFEGLSGKVYSMGKNGGWLGKWLSG